MFDQFTFTIYHDNPDKTRPKAHDIMLIACTAFSLCPWSSWYCCTSGRTIFQSRVIISEKRRRNSARMAVVPSQQ